ncbi:MAG TPA: c-type cytochrome [Polyangiaceae bacterium]
MLRRLLSVALVLLLTVGSGTLECGGPRPSLEERQGAALYKRMCVVCHGKSGEGYAADRAPALANQVFLASVTDDYLRAAISDGRGGTTMSAWSVVRGGPLARAQVDDVVAFLRTWQDGPRATLDERPPKGDVMPGGELYSRTCLPCHGPRGTGGLFVAVGGAELLASASNGFLRQGIRKGRPDTPMVGYEASLGDAEVENVVTLLRSWQAPAAGVIRPPPARPPPIPLGPVPLNPRGPEPVGFHTQPLTTKADVVKQQLDRGARMALLDARAPSDYLGEHIAGAVSVPFYEPEPYFSQLPRDVWLVAYCACPHAESGTLAAKLASAGFTKVTVLDEGLGVWRSKKYPTSTGLDP